VLTVTVGSSNPFTIPVTEIASGLFLKLPASVNSFHPTSGVQFTSQTFLLKNMGDIGANITLALGSDSPALLRLNTQKQQPGTSKITSYIDHASSSGGATVTDYIINVSTNGQRGTELVTASAPGSTPLCWPMPTMSVVGQ
jgi:hypothetical protein